MEKMIIKNGRVIDPSSGRDEAADLLLEDGRVIKWGKNLQEEDPDAEVIDASGKIVCPGFIDIHMHEDPVENGHIRSNEETSIARSMLRMGVTTAIGGNCGLNVYDPGSYLNMLDADGSPINMGLLAGHSWFRKAAGCRDKYAPVSDDALQKICQGLKKALAEGCFGISYGIRYVPGIDARELTRTMQIASGTNALVAAHVRDDAAAIFSAAAEFLDSAKMAEVRAQVSHIGSMAGFGQMKDFLHQVDEYRRSGLDVMCDCYPYDAFSTELGSTTYDEGWMDRYQCGYNVVELCEGLYKGQRCTEEIFRKERKENPGCLTVCYVMKEADVDMALQAPGVMVASDGILNNGQGHPRAAGTFPRVFSSFVRTGKLNLMTAIKKMTFMPADRLGLACKGRITPGADADIVIFDPDGICDRADFAHPLTAPDGIEYVLIGGQIAFRNKTIVNGRLGHAVRRNSDE